MSNQVSWGILNTLTNDYLLMNMLKDKIVTDVDPFIPNLNGNLQKSVTRITRPHGVTLIWNEPYAQYVYGGKAMEYPAGTPVGWAAKKGYKKVVTNRPLHYTDDVNPQAQGHWVDHAWLVNGQSWEQLIMHGLGAK
ncbi:minor capsid protein [Furfurilactobacillus entadae]|uniref:minor capsid protein n=1 Tax=Furfurilactobacillus entadae TaxID=2922307 RepID=UPI0035ED4810